METVLNILLIIVVCYLIGSFPTAVIISKLFFKFDIREQGSGNMGSTNTIRVLGLKWGLLVQVIDILKGYLSVVVIANLLGNNITIPNVTSFEDLTIIKIIAGISAVIGHIFPIFAGFKGGKGINTATGMMIGLVPTDVAIAFVLFVLALLSSGYVSLGSIVAAFTIPSSLLVRYNIFGADIPGYNILIVFSFIIMLLVIFTHRSNIKRILKGTENKFHKIQLIKLNFKKKIKK